MVNRERKTIKIKIENVTDQLEGPLADCIATLQNYLAEYPSAWLSFEDTASQYDPDERWGLVIYDKLLETDDEYVKRIAQETVMDNERDRWDRLNYERLKAKFGEA
jgi:hypothetical protein